MAQTTINQKTDKTSDWLAADDTARAKFYIPVYDDNQTLATLIDGRLDSNVLTTTQKLNLPVANKTGGIIAVNTLVKLGAVDGSLGEPTITVATNATPIFADGFILSQINDNATGEIVRAGILKGLDTSSGGVGDFAYLGTGGAITLTKPANDQILGIVLKVDAVDGWILFDPTIDYERGQLPDFQATHDYPANFLIAEQGAIYRAKTAFTSGASFSSSDWDNLTGQDAATPEDFGADGTGASDATSEVAAAIATGHCRLVNTYKITSGLTISTDKTIVEGTGSLICDTDWIDDELINVTADDCVLRDFSILETGADPTNSNKSGSNNKGIGVTGDRNRIRGMIVQGFNFPISLTGATDTVLEDLQLSDGYGYGLEIDSSSAGTRVEGIRATNNRLGGCHASGSYTDYEDCDFNSNLDVGLRQSGGTGCNLLGVSALINSGNGISLDSGYGTSLEGCQSLGNLGTSALSIGTTDDDSFERRRVSVSRCAFHGNYDPSLVGTTDHELATTLMSTTYGIRIHSDSADVEIDESSFANLRSRPLHNLGENVVLRDSSITNWTDSTINDAAGRLIIERTKFNGAMWKMSYSNGDGSIPVAGETVTSSGASGVLLRVEVASGTWPTADAGGSLWVRPTTGVFTDSDSLTFGGGATCDVDGITATNAIRIQDGIGEIYDCEITLESLRTDVNAIYVDSTNDDFRHRGNRQTNCATLIQLETAAKVLAEDLIASDWGALPDGTTDTATEQNAMFQACEDSLVARVVYPPSDLPYCIGSSLLLPTRTAVDNKKLSIVGHGAVIKTLANNLTVFDRSIATVGAISTTALVPEVVGFSFVGQATDTSTAGTGMRWDGAHSAVFRDCNFKDLAVGFYGIWCMESQLIRCHFEGCISPIIITNGDNSRISDGDESNSNSNDFRIESCRITMSDSTGTAIQMLYGADNALVNTTVEGTACDTVLEVSSKSESGDLERREFTVDHLHVETTTVGTVIKANLYRSGLEVRSLQLPTRATSPDTVFLDDDASIDSDFAIGAVDFYNWNGVGSSAWFANVVRAAGDQNLYTFEGSKMHPSTPTFIDASLWSNGVPVPQPRGWWKLRGTGFVEA